jgi:type II secretory pathway pseudopilin PulG
MELLVVVVIVGVLAAIAIPKFVTAKNRAYVQTMRSDLRNLMGAQLMYRQEQEPPSYAPDLALLGNIYRTSAGVTVTITQGDEAGFGATATHSASNSTCAVFRGATAVPPATVEGEITCQ